MSDHWNEKMFPWDAKTPRFYPPGEHPAIQQEYEALRVAEEYERAASAIPGPEMYHELYLYIDYLRERIADFESREAELKAEAFYRSRRTPS